MKKILKGIYSFIKDFYIYDDVTRKIRKPNFIITILTFIFALWLVNVAFLSRLLRVIFPRQVFPTVIEGEPFTIWFWFVLISCLMSIYWTIKHIYKILDLYQNNQVERRGFVYNIIKSTIDHPISQAILHVLHIYVIYFIQAPLNIWRQFDAKIWGGPQNYVQQDRLFWLHKKFLPTDPQKLDPKKREFRLVMFIMIFSNLPKLIVAIVYFYEVVIVRELYLFYRMFPLILITITFWNLVTLFRDRNIASGHYIRTFVIEVVQYIPEKDEYIIARRDNVNEELHELYCWRFVKAMSNFDFMKEIYKLSSKYSCITGLVSSILYGTTSAVWLLVMLKIL